MLNIENPKKIRGMTNRLISTWLTSNPNSEIEGIWFRRLLKMYVVRGTAPAYLRAWANSTFLSARLRMSTEEWDTCVEGDSQED